MNIYVGNLAYRAKEMDIRAQFEAFGAVSAVKIVTDRDSGLSKGFCFVEMPNDDEAKKAIDSLNGNDFQGRALVVNQARERTERAPFQGGGSSGGGPRGPRTGGGNSGGPRGGGGRGDFGGQRSNRY